MTSPLVLTDVDRRIWDEELAGFVPQKVFDAHTHIYRWAFNTDPEKDKTGYRRFVAPEFEEAGYDVLDTCDELLMPGRNVQRLSFPFPFSPCCDFAESNRYIADQMQDKAPSAALMLVHPEMTSDELDRQIAEFGFVGLKPYRLYSSTGDVDECRITDFLPEHQIEIAHQRGLIIMMHLSKRDAVADQENIEDLLRLTRDYPNARWILAHCARSYSAWAIEKAAPHLRGLPNVWYDTSSVCESDAVEALCRSVGHGRVMYGSDDVPVGVLRGKYIAFGFAWAYLSSNNHDLNLSHCCGEMTFTRYEQLRAMRRACMRLELSPQQVEAMFYDTAAALVAGAGKELSA